jgi:hypothetical protein
MRLNVLGVTLGGIVTMLAVGAAQDRTPAQPQTPQTSPAPAAREQTATITVEGCLVREQDVPGREPNVVERAGVLEDYILTNAKMVKGTAPADSSRAADQPTGTSGSTSAISAPMYDVKGIDDDRLKAMVGKRIEVDGTWGDVQKSPTAGPNEDLADIHATAIREIAGASCPAVK